MSSLSSDRYGQIVEMRIGGKTYREIGNVLGISRQRVHKICGKSTCYKFCISDRYEKACRKYPRYFGIRHIGIVDFWHRVKIGNSDECWPWIAGIGKKKRYYDIGSHGNSRGVHIIACEFIRGPCPEGYEACHSCNNCICCNPNHIFWGTHQQNIDDRERRYKSGELKRQTGLLSQRKLPIAKVQ